MMKNRLEMVIRKAILSTLFLSISFAGFAYAAEPVVEANTIPLLESVRQNYLAHERLMALKNNKTANIKKDAAANMWLKKVQPDHVNMVTNRYSVEQQDAVQINGKTYFASGDGYAYNIRENASVRFAKDPVTNNTIDKADAVTYTDASGRILYFESDMSFEQFVGLASSSTLYGYSK